MGNVRMRAEQINYGASNVKVALDDLDPKDLIALSARMDTIEAWKATVKAEEKTGASVEYTNALALAAVSLSAEIEPIQDLHGYDKPWVGGADVNKGDFTDGYNLGVDGLPYAYEGRCATVNPITIVADTTYYVAKFGTGTGFIYSVFDSEDVLVRRETVTSGSALNVSGGAYFYICAYDGTVSAIQPMLTIGSVPTAYRPYSNICPISGRTEARVDDHGKNFIDPNNLGHTTYSSSTGQAERTDPSFTSTTNMVAVEAGATYCLSKDGTMASARRFYYRADGTFVSSAFGNTAFTIPSGVSYFRFHTGDYSGSLTGWQLEKNGTVTPYEPYKSSSVTIQLGQTVYGGTLNVTTGVLTITHANIASYNGETIGEPWISSMDEYTEGGTPTTGAQVVYTLATPTTIQLTPEQLTMLKGYNRLSSDGGGDITVKAYTGAPWGGDEA